MSNSKTLWHKELKELSPVAVTVKSERQKSKFSKPNEPKPDFVCLVINGQERLYNVENDACGNFFAGQRGRSFTIIAEGSREDATITYVGEAAATVGHQPPPAARPPQPPAAPQPPQHYDSNPPGRPGGAPPPPPPASTPPPRDAKHEAEIFIARRLAAQKITVRATMALAAEFEQVYNMPMPFELVQSINGMMFIAGDRAGIFDALPLDIKLSVPKTPAA
jgi:hypothetical protein